MSAGLSLPMLSLILFCIFAEAGRECCFKSAADASAKKALVKNPLLWLGILFWATEMLVWTHVLGTVPLNIAFPFMAFSYVAILLAGKYLLHERVDRRHAAGAVLITLGVGMIGVTGL